MQGSLPPGATRAPGGSCGRVGGLYEDAESRCQVLLPRMCTAIPEGLLWREPRGTIPPLGRAVQFGSSCTLVSGWASALHHRAHASRT